MNVKERHHHPRPPGDHDPDCHQPGMLWQAPLRSDLPLRGYCPQCGAVAIKPPAGIHPPDPTQQQNGATDE